MGYVASNGITANTILSNIQKEVDVDHLSTISILRDDAEARKNLSSKSRPSYKESNQGASGYSTGMLTTQLARVC
jgi:hypothetical protein